MPASRLVNRNVIAGRGRTSMRLEPEFWTALAEICRREQMGMPGLIRRIEAFAYQGGRTSAVRVFVLEYFRTGLVPAQASPAEAQHKAAA